MRIGVFFESPIRAGGGFQQALTTTQSVLGKLSHAYEFVVFAPDEASRAVLRECGISARIYRHPSLSRLLDRLSSTAAAGALFRAFRRLGWKRIGRHFDAFLTDSGIDLVLFCDPAPLALCVADHPFIFTLWDLCHHDWPEFPEVREDRNFERRERINRSLLPRAVAVVVSAPSIAMRVTELYGVDRHRVVVLPFLPSRSVREKTAAAINPAEVAEVRNRFGLAAEYVFYPAQLWAHKNHLYLLEALADLERRHGVTLHAAFCGGDKGNLSTIEGAAARLGLSGRLHMLGFVADADLPALYSGAFALVMPTYFGPTNIPPLEAASMGCPVVYSDLPHFRDEMGDAALYCDLSEPSSLADHLWHLGRDATFRKRLIAEGGRLAAERAEIDYGAILAPVIDNFAQIRRRWLNPPA